MTTERALFILHQRCKNNTEAKEALEFLKKSVTQKCDDAISREMALDGVDAMYNNSWDIKDFRENVNLMLNKLPPVQPIREIKPKEEMTVKETISDLIWLLGSNLLDKGSEDTVLNAIYYLENQPSRKGHWIAHSDGGIWIKYYECSECHKHKSEKTDFCPNCGADMRGDTE